MLRSARASPSLQDCFLPISFNSVSAMRIVSALLYQVVLGRSPFSDGQHSWQYEIYYVLVSFTMTHNEDLEQLIGIRRRMTLMVSRYGLFADGVGFFKEKTRR